MRIEVVPEAREDLIAGFQFYERQGRGRGTHFLNCIFEDMDSLAIHGGVHSKVFGYHRGLSKRFPFAIYCRVEEKVVRVRAILDCRRNPSWIRRRLRGA